jgi:hypothetical protein
MPSSVASVFNAAELEPEGVVQWGSPVPTNEKGVYIVASTSRADSRAAPGARCPLDLKALRQWLEVRPELRMDGKRPSPDALGRRIAEFWLPDEPILYVGLTTRSLRSRVNEYYKTPLGARKPHAGGHFLKTLKTLEQLHVHFARCAVPSEAEDLMLKAFCGAVSVSTLGRLRDSAHPFPFANLEWPRGTRKDHGLSGTKER